MREILRIAKSGARIVITVPDGRKDIFLGHINFWSSESFRVFLEYYTDEPVVQRLGADTLLSIIIKK
jgi:predicted methyltransferase